LIGIAAETAVLFVDDERRVWMLFSDDSQLPVVVRRFGLPGEVVVRGRTPDWQAMPTLV